MKLMLFLESVALLFLATAGGFDNFGVGLLIDSDFSKHQDEHTLNDLYPGGVSEWGQTFNLNTVTRVTSVEFLLWRNSEDLPTANLMAVIYLWDTRTNSPSEVLAISKSINSTLLPGTWVFSLTKFEFEEGPLLAPLRTYALAIRGGDSGRLGAGDVVFIATTDLREPPHGFFYFFCCEDGEGYVVNPAYAVILYRLYGRIPGMVNNSPR